MHSDIHSYPRRYGSHYELTELPWFELRKGRLTLAQDSLSPIADVHTHLALTFGRRRSVDLWAAPADTEHYLSIDAPVDLDVYANRNFTDTDLQRLTTDLGLRTVTSGGMRRTHTAPNLTREMRELGVATSVLLPIELPYLSRNAETYLDVASRRRGSDLVSLGSVHPFEHAARERLARQKELGALGVKLHPAVQLVPPDNARAMAVYRACADLDLPVLWHCGPVDIETRAGRWCSQLKHYWNAVHQNPRTTFVLGHSGALQMELALELAKRYPNVYLELSSQSLSNVRRIVCEGPGERIMFGSDWPFYHQAMPLAKVLIATDDRRELRPRILWDNAAQLFGLERP